MALAPASTEGVSTDTASADAVLSDAVSIGAVPTGGASRIVHPEPSRENELPVPPQKFVVE